MRRRLQRYLPVVLIALVVQILAPVAACWAAATVISDPLGAVEICHSDPASQAADSDPRSDHRTHGGACVICCAAHASASFDAPRLLALPVRYLRPTPVTWRNNEPALPAFAVGSIARARAPPHLS